MLNFEDRKNLFVGFVKGINSKTWNIILVFLVIFLLFLKCDRGGDYNENEKILLDHLIEDYDRQVEKSESLELELIKNKNYTDSLENANQSLKYEIVHEKRIILGLNTIDAIDSVYAEYRKLRDGK